MAPQMIPSPNLSDIPATPSQLKKRQEEFLASFHALNNEIKMNNEQLQKIQQDAEKAQQLQHIRNQVLNKMEKQKPGNVF